MFCTIDAKRDRLGLRVIPRYAPFDSGRRRGENGFFVCSTGLLETLCMIFALQNIVDKRTDLCRIPDDDTLRTRIALRGVGRSCVASLRSRRVRFFSSLFANVRRDGEACRISLNPRILDGAQRYPRKEATLQPRSVSGRCPGPRCTVIRDV